MPIIRAPSGAYLPKSPVTDLVRAALLDGESARRGWERGRTVFELPEGQRAPAANWLRPLLAANLDRLAIEDPLLDELRTAREAAGRANARLFDHVGVLVDRLAAEGVDAMLLKGAALVGGDGADASARPMSDVDLLVPLDLGRQAVEVAGSAGWMARHRVSAAFLSVKHAAHFADVDGCQLDLHWYVYEECMRPGIDDGVWRRSTAAGFRGTAARRPATADALLHACVHGARWTRTPGIRWLTDAWRIIDGGGVAWETLLAEADRRAFVVRLRRTLIYLRRSLGAPVPPWVETWLGDYRPGLTERLEHAALGYEQTRLGALPGYWFAFHRAQLRDRPAAIVQFPRYLADAWEVESVRDLLRAGAERAVDRLSGAAARRGR